MPESFEHADQGLEKQLQWEEQFKKIERITDGLALEIDEKVKETVAAINLMGIPTSGSCEGHLDRGYAYPWVEVEVEEVGELYEKAALLQKEGKDETPEYEVLMKEMRAKNLAVRRKLIELLDEFYRERAIPAHIRLTIQSRGGGASRLESQGGDSQEVEEEGVRVQNLIEFQKEMKAFTEFLKDRFFKG